MSTGFERFPWETSREYVLAESSYMACAYNAAVNYGSERGGRKMGDLIRAINHHARVEGAAKLAWLQQQGVITEWKPCPDGCEVRPGGLFHVAGCENDVNSPVSQVRRDAAQHVLPARLCHAAVPTLVGERKPSTDTEGESSNG